MSEMSEMSAPAERPTDHQHPLAALSGHRPAHVLACWGLASLLPGAALRFEGDWAVPVLTWDGDAEALAQVAAEALVAGTWDLESRMPQELQALKPKEYQTTTPSRTVANALARAAWEACREPAVLAGSGIVQTYDLSASSQSVKEADIQVRSAALTLLSGTSYTAKSVQDTWFLLGAGTREAARDAAAVEIARLFDGRLAVAEAESIIDTQVNAFMNWMVQRQSVPLIQELHARGDAVRQQEVERARKMLAKGEDPAVVLEALSRALTAKFMHGPTTLLSHHAGKDPELANMLSGLLPVPRGGR